MPLPLAGALILSSLIGAGANAFAQDKARAAQSRLEYQRQMLEKQRRIRESLDAESAKRAELMVSKLAKARAGSMTNMQLRQRNIQPLGASLSEAVLNEGRYGQ